MSLFAPPIKFTVANPIKPLSSQKRQMKAKAFVSHNQTVREVEMFNAAPSINKLQSIIDPKNSSFRYLRFQRVLLSKKEIAYKEITISQKNEEAAYYINDGVGKITVDGKTYTLHSGDVLYVGIHKKVTLATTSKADISQYKAIDCTTAYPTTLIAHREIETTQFAANLGTKRFATKRTVYKLIDGGNLQACRLLFGDTYVAKAGAVGSYPPHFHGPDGRYGYGDEAKEEIYHFRVQSDIKNDVPFVLQNCQRPEEKLGSYFTIQDDCAVNVTAGYHDTIAPPAVTFKFVWCLASFTEGHRDWSQVLNKPGYENEW